MSNSNYWVTGCCGFWGQTYVQSTVKRQAGYEKDLQSYAETAKTAGHGAIVCSIAEHGTQTAEFFKALQAQGWRMVSRFRNPYHQRTEDGEAHPDNTIVSLWIKPLTKQESLEVPTTPEPVGR